MLKKVEMAQRKDHQFFLDVKSKKTKEKSYVLNVSDDEEEDILRGRDYVKTITYKYSRAHANKLSKYNMQFKG